MVSFLLLSDISVPSVAHPFVLEIKSSKSLGTRPMRFCVLPRPLVLMACESLAFFICLLACLTQGLTQPRPDFNWLCSQEWPRPKEGHCSVWSPASVSQVLRPQVSATMPCFLDTWFLLLFCFDLIWFFFPFLTYELMLVFGIYFTASCGLCIRLTTCLLHMK